MSKMGFPDKVAPREVPDARRLRALAKVANSAAKRRVVQHRVESGLLSERRGCRPIEVSRSTVRYKAHGPDDSDLRSRMKALAEKYPRYSYPMLHTMLRIEGLVKNPKRTHRIYSEEGLQVRTKKRKKLTRPCVPMVLPTVIDKRW